MLSDDLMSLTEAFQYFQDGGIAIEPEGITHYVAMLYRITCHAILLERAAGPAAKKLADRLGPAMPAPIAEGT